jgi:hypothetical protein
MHEFISQQDFFTKTEGTFDSTNTVLSLLGSFPGSTDQILHWDYKPKGLHFLFILFTFTYLGKYQVMLSIIISFLIAN